MICEDEAR